MRSTRRSVAIGGSDDEPPVATEPTYFTRQDIDRIGGASLVVHHPFTVVALGQYRGEMRRAIHAMKFRNCRWIAVAFGQQLARAVSKHDSQWQPDLITWAPTTSRRLRMRGHDQSAIIAASVARRSHSRCLRTLRRVDDRAQTGATRQQRHRGPRFVVRSHAVCGRAILLVDDVMTTGTTLMCARKALLGAGAREVRCAVIAQVKARVSAQIG